MPTYAWKKLGQYISKDESGKYILAENLCQVTSFETESKGYNILFDFAAKAPITIAMGISKFEKVEITLP